MPATSFRDRLKRLLNPALCLTCAIPIDADQFICPHCLADLTRVERACSLCGLPNRTEQAVCPACRHHPPPWQRMVAPLIYQGESRQLIQDFKFNDRLYLANALVTHLLHYFRPTSVDVLLPVPLHDRRFKERGFNQSEEIARRLSSALGLPCDTNSLVRVRATESQAGLSLNKRRKNLRGAFSYRPSSPYRSVAIIDDVITSGSTMSELSRLLNMSGVEHIEVWSLARALKHD